MAANRPGLDGRRIEPLVVPVRMADSISAAVWNRFAGSFSIARSMTGCMPWGSDFNCGVGPEMVIWRFLPGGSLDTGFGTAGVAIHGSAAGGNSGDFAEAITLDLQGRILVAGWSYNGTDNDIVVWRYE